MADERPTDQSNVDGVESPTEAQQQQRRRQQAVRDKLQQLYGDDSAETVRRFLHELTDGEDGDDDGSRDHGATVH